MEKPQPTTTVSVVSSEDEQSQDVRPISRWTPGYRNRFPYFSAVALGCIAILAGVALGVLIGSDGVSTTQWSRRIAPNVVLSAINALSSIALAIAVAEGVAIAWWRHAMKGSTVKNLHHQWELSSGIYALITQPKSLFTSSIALAVLATQITLLNSILYQRATTTFLAQDPAKALTCVGIAAQEFPATGYIVSNATVGEQARYDSFMAGDSYIPVVNNWQTANGFFTGYNELFRFSDEKTFQKSSSLKYCDGICIGSIETIGFQIDCVETDSHQDIAGPAIEAYQNNGNESAWTNIPIFHSNFSLEYPSDTRNYTQLTIDLQYFRSDDPFGPMTTTCPGTVSRKQCSLRPAIISYPIRIKNFTSPHVINGVELYTPESLTEIHDLNADVPHPKYNSELKQADGFTVVSYLYPEGSRDMRALTSLGGIVNALSQFLASSATIDYVGMDDSWSLNLLGTLAGRMMYGPPNMGTCDCSFRDNSLDFIIASINQLTFLTATGMVETEGFVGLPKGKKAFPATLPEATVLAVDSNITSRFVMSDVEATQFTDVVHYQTNYIFAGLAFGITILCIIMVVPSFWHYGELGRQVTLDPVEIANAFGAPILTHEVQRTEGEEDDDETIEKLMTRIGDRKIVYGFADVHGPDEHRHMQLDQDRGAPVSSNPTSPTQSAPLVTSSSPATNSPNAGLGIRAENNQPTTTPTVHKRRSVRLAMGTPENIRPTSQVYSVKSPRLGHVTE